MACVVAWLQRQWATAFTLKLPLFLLAVVNDSVRFVERHHIFSPFPLLVSSEALKCGWAATREHGYRFSFVCLCSSAFPVERELLQN